MRFDRIRDHRPLRTGHSVCESRIRFGNYFHLMREIVHLHLAWVPRVPSFDVKALLGIHVYEDATFVRRIRQRLQELEVPGTYPASPGDGLSEIIDALNAYETWEEYVAAIYSVIKPGLMDAWESHFTTGDPLLDEPSQRLMARFMQITAQHISGGMGLLESLYQNGPQTSERLHKAVSKMRPLWEALGSDFGTSPLSVGHKRLPTPKSYAGLPLRDENMAIEKVAASLPTFTQAVTAIASEEQDSVFAEKIVPILHAQMNRQIIFAEIYALSAHENPQFPWEFQEAFSRMTWDKIRHAQALDKLLGSFGGEWGTQPVDLSDFAAMYRAPLHERLVYIATKKDLDVEKHDRLHAKLLERRQPYLANILDHLVAEADHHRRVCAQFADMVLAQPGVSG